MRLKDKVAIVTGAAQGLGRAFSIALAGQGAKVMVVDLSTERLCPHTRQDQELSSPGRNWGSSGERRLHLVHNTSLLRPDDIQAHRMGQGPE